MYLFNYCFPFFSLSLRNKVVIERGLRDSKNWKPFCSPLSYFNPSSQYCKEIQREVIKETTNASYTAHSLSKGEQTLTISKEYYILFIWGSLLWSHEIMLITRTLSCSLKILRIILLMYVFLLLSNTQTFWAYTCSQITSTTLMTSSFLGHF